MVEKAIVSQDEDTIVLVRNIEYFEVWEFDGYWCVYAYFANKGIKLGVYKTHEDASNALFYIAYALCCDEEHEDFINMLSQKEAELFTREAVT